MNNRDLAIDYLNESKIRLETAESAFNKKAYAFCVRQSQEAVELSLKAALRMIGVDFPKWHDVSDILLEKKENFSHEFQEHILKLAEISISLTKKRELAMYGNEISSRPPSKIFDKKDAGNALKDVRFCIKHVDLFFQTLQNIDNPDKEKDT